MYRSVRRVSLIVAFFVAIAFCTANHTMGAAGDLDPSFGAGGVQSLPINQPAYRVRIQADGKIVLVGNYLYSDASFLARLSPDGTLDPSFGVGGVVAILESPPIDILYDFILQPDGKIVAVGSRSDKSYVGSNAIFRFNSDGSRDVNFGTNGVVVAASSGSGILKIALQPDGKFVVPMQGLVARYLANGTLDTHFGQSGMIETGLSGMEVEVQDDGAIVVLGKSGDGRTLVVRYHPDGSSDSGFGILGIAQVGPTSESIWVTSMDLKLLPDGRILTIHGADEINSAITRLLPDGTSDQSFGSGGSISLPHHDVPELAMQRDGKPLLAGRIVIGNVFTTSLSRFNLNGSVDNSFGDQGLVLPPGGLYNTMALQSDGKIVTAGYQIAGNYTIIARFLNPDSSTAKFDYDGDGKTDLSVWSPSSGMWSAMPSSGGSLAINWGQPGDKPAPADYDGDGKTDMAVWRPSNGNWYLFGSATQSFSVRSWGELGDIPAPGDFDADGRAEINVFRPSTALWYRINTSDGHWVVAPYGQVGDVPVIGDFDADGRDDLAVYRPSNGTWYIQRTSAGYVVVPFGGASPVIAPADYTGDGRTDIAVISSQSGNWLYYNWDTGLPTVVVDGFYQSGDIPVPGDFDGNGSADFAIFRPSTALWRIPGPSGNSEIHFGTNNDIPTPGAFLR